MGLSHGEGDKCPEEHPVTAWLLWDAEIAIGIPNAAIAKGIPLLLQEMGSSILGCKNPDHAQLDML